MKNICKCYHSCQLEFAKKVRGNNENKSLFSTITTDICVFQKVFKVLIVSTSLYVVYMNIDMGIVYCHFQEHVMKCLVVLNKFIMFVHWFIYFRQLKTQVRFLDWMYWELSMNPLLQPLPMGWTNQETVCKYQLTIRWQSCCSQVV